MALGICQAAERAVEAALARGPAVLLVGLGLAIVGTALAVYMLCRGVPGPAGPRGRRAAMGRPKKFTTNPGGVVLVTGASRGIGHDAAIALAKQGYVVAAGVRRQVDADKIRSLGLGNLEPVFIDVTKEISIDTALRAVNRMIELKKVPFAGLVNTARVAARGPLEYHDFREVRQVFEVNFFGTMAVTARLLPLLRQHQGRIVNVGSNSGDMPLPEHTAYSSSKWAVEGMTDSLRLEVEPLGLSVSLIVPDAVTTSLHDKQASSSPEAASLAYPHLFAEKAVAAVVQDSQDAVAAIVHAIHDQKPYDRYHKGWANGQPQPFVSPADLSPQVSAPTKTTAATAISSVDSVPQ